MAGYLPITDEFRQRLLVKREQAQTEYLIEYRGRPATKRRRSMRTAWSMAGMTYRCRMYDIRHLFASVMLAGGADLAAVTKLFWATALHR